MNSEPSFTVLCWENEGRGMEVVYEKLLLCNCLKNLPKKKKNPITFVRTMPNSGIAMRVHYLQL